MNKTIIININGIVFHIEEDAYEILKNYMTDVKRHFSNSADSLEITTDIENRIAEMFSELLEKEGRQVIFDQDVKTVTEQMGSVADFENAENDGNANNYIYNNRNTEGRRLFRDPDDHLVGGVCAGIANYFDTNPVWIRLAFAVAVAFAGTGLLLYIILWIVVPRANSRADRMAMKGEKQNLQGFKKNLEDELSSVKQSLHHFGHEAKPFVYQARDFVGDFFHHLGLFIGGAGKILVKLLGIAILIACFAGIVALVVGLITVFILGRDLDMFPFRMIKSDFAEDIYVAGFLVAFIPLMAIIMGVFKGIFNVGGIGRSTGTVFLAIWICALSFIIYCGVRIASQFRESAKFIETVNIKPTKNSTYYLKLNDIKYFSHEDSVRLSIKDHFKNMIVTDDDYNGFHNEPRSVSIEIVKSDVTHPELEEQFSAQGANYETALFNARNTSYVFAQQDSVLKFDYTLRKMPNRSWHDEEVHLILKLPLNSKVVVDQKLDGYVEYINLYQCKEDNKKENATSATFIMTDNGLQCKVDTLVTMKKDSLKTDSASR